MTIPSGYDKHSLLYQNDTIFICRVKNKDDKKAYILKGLKSKARNEKNIAAFSNEAYILSSLKFEHIVRLIKSVSSASECFHIFEDIEATSLYMLLQSNCLDLNEKLHIALNLSIALLVLHQKEILHLNINPKNIIYNSKTKRLQIIDFTRASSSLKEEASVSFALDDFSLLYSSPEQSNRLSVKVDERSDFYSLGMTLYHLFLGRSPVEGKDRSEVLHKQMALSPVLLSLVDSTIPTVISSIIDKLISKQTQQRYQSMQALSYDLSRCIKNLVKGDIIPFTVASHDYPTIQFGQSLFGRNEEIKVLERISENINKSKKQHLLISGLSGVGKSRLVEELLRKLPSDVRVIRTKFDQYNTVPYLCFKQLFSQLTTLLISQNNVGMFKNIDFHSTQVLNIMFEELAPLFNDKVQKKYINPEELASQLVYAMQVFFYHVVTKEHPLVFYVDDMQWADEASISLIESVVVGISNDNFHFVGSFRTNEVKANKPLDSFVNASELANFESIKLISLNEEDLHSLLEFELHITKEDKIFSQAIYNKTDGNPFYLKSFIEYLIDKNILYFEDGKWHYDLAELKKCEATLNIAQMINNKLMKLNKIERSYLEYLAVLGSSFSTGITKKCMDYLGFKNNLFDDSQRYGFIEVYENNYQFSHDQIHQSIYKQIDKSKRIKMHRSIGLFLETQYSKGEYHNITHLVYHLNNAYAKSEFPVRIFWLNNLEIEELLVKNSSSFALTKLRFIEANFSLDKIRKNYTYKVFNFDLLRAKILYLTTYHEEALTIIRELFTKVKNIDDKLKCFNLYKDITVTKGQGFSELMQVGIELLGELGVAVPKEKFLASKTDELYKKVIKHDSFLHPLKVLQMHTMREGKRSKVLELLADFWEVLYYLPHTELMTWSILMMVNNSFTYGNRPHSTFGYVLFGSLLVAKKEYKKALLFGDVALKLNKKQENASMVPAIYNFVGNFIKPFSRPICENIPLYEKSLLQSKINNNLVFGTWANFLMHFSDYLSGDNLDRVSEHIQEESSFLLASGDKKMIAIFRVLKHSIDVLKGKEIEPCDEKNSIALWEGEHFLPALAWYAVIKAQEAFLRGEFYNALVLLNTYVKSEDHDVIMFAKVRLHFIRALLLLAKDDLNSLEEETLKRDTSECLMIYKASPRSFRCEKLLLEAEMNKNSLSSWDVAKLYDEALDAARQAQNASYIAFVSLCAGRFWKKLNLMDLSTSYFNISIIGLKEWGAMGLVPDIEKQRQLIEGKDTKLSYDTKEMFNQQSILKSFTAISQSKDNKEVISLLMQTILESATASKTVLVIREKEVFKVKAHVDFNDGHIHFSNEKLEISTLLPKNMVTYSINQEEKYFSNDPSSTEIFEGDPYIKKYKPVFCACIPIKIESLVEAVLYIENKDLETKFDDEDIQTLEHLLTQAFIIYKNTSLYESLKVSSQSLNKAQEISHMGAWEYDHESKKITWTAETYRIYEMEPFCMDIDFEWLRDHLYPDDVEHINVAIDKAFEGERNYEVYHRIITDKGNIKFVHQRAEAFMDKDIPHMSGIIHDVTQSRLADDTVLRLSQVFEQTPLNIFITDLRGEIKYVNQQSVLSTGYTIQELVGSNMSIFNSGIQDNKIFETLWETLALKKVWKGTFINKMKSGENMDCHSTIFPIYDANDDVINYVSIQEDMTEQNIKDKLFVMQTRQAQMGEMLSMIAHQWRQPLSIITTLTAKQRVNITLGNASDEKSLKAYDDIELQVKHLSHTISDFRDFFRPDKQKSLIKGSRLVDMACNLLSHSLDKKFITVKKDYLNDVEIFTFEHEVQQVVLNIIKNAEDAIIENEIENPVIIIRVDCDAINLMITIEDNAGGIDEKVMDTLFLPYVSTKSEQNGTGIGLYMSKTIVEEHCKGSLTVINTAIGARFTALLPLKVDDD